MRVPYSVTMPTSTRGTHRATLPIVAVVLACAAVVVSWPAPVQTAGAGLPPMFQRYLDTIIRPGAGERRRLLAGQPLTKVLDTEDNEQVSVVGAIWIDAPVQRYVEAIRNIETWEQGKSFHITRRIGAPPRLEDFDGLRLRPALVDDLRTCRLDNCAAKLDAPTIDAVRGLDWASADVHAAAERLMRRYLYDYSRGYLAGGNDRLAVFRDKSVPVSTADEFRAMVDDIPTLTTFLPDVRRYLLDFPRAWLPGASSFLYWQEAEFGLKPTIRVSHLTISERSTETVVVSKMIYANHYFRSALEVRMLVPDPARGQGFWLVTVVTSRTDGMTGFTGLFVRRKVRSGAREGSETILVDTKRRMEATR